MDSKLEADLVSFLTVKSLTIKQIISITKKRRGCIESALKRLINKNIIALTKKWNGKTTENLYSLLENAEYQQANFNQLLTKEWV